MCTALEQTQVNCAGINDVAALEERLSRPSGELESDLASIDGDILILGASGKMGPSLARMAKRAAPHKTVYGAARFTDAAVADDLSTHGIEVLKVDLLDPDAVARLPNVKNVVLMAGFKFGAGNAPAHTWATNTLLASRVAAGLTDCRLVAFSTGCVYPFVPIQSGGATEAFPTTPSGEYANSCVGRERLIEWQCEQNNVWGRHFRLNYAIELRYGVLCDIAVKVRDGEPIDVSTGYVNVIWQGDANAMALRCLTKTTNPVSPINVTGPEVLSIRWLAELFAERLGKPANLVGQEAETAWLSNASEAFRLFGYPRTPLLEMVDLVADWTARSMPVLGKSTGYEVRTGNY